MKKLIAIAVLFVSVTAAVLAQDDEGKWKVGFMARFVTDMLSATSVKEKFVYTPVDGRASYTEEFGNYNKGTINFFGNRDTPWHTGPGQRLLLSLSNSGENYDVYVDMKLDDWVSNTGGGTHGEGGHEGWGGAVWDLITAGNADWHVNGTAGIFYATLGTSGFETFTSTQATWNDWLGWNQLCRFGVWRGNDWNNDFVVSSNFRTWNTWGAIAAISATFADNYRFGIGYRINPTFAPWYWGSYNPNDASPFDSKSSINASFMFSGRPVDGITFDLYYSVIGGDNDTKERPRANPVTARYGEPDDFWRNTIGAYVGINLIENLGISLGYAVNFNVYEAGGWLQNDYEANRDVTYKAPIYSGIDLHVKYSGIDKLGLTFNNNFSFASVKGEKYYGDHPWNGDLDIYSSSIVYALGETKGVFLGDGWTQDWFHWNTELTADLGFIDGVGLRVSLGDQLGVKTSTYVRPADVPVDVKPNKDATVALNNEFRVSVFADHGIGSVTVGAGLYFGVKSFLGTSDYTWSDTTGTVKTVSTSDRLEFGIPILFKVAF